MLKVFANVVIYVIHLSQRAHCKTKSKDLRNKHYFENQITHILKINSNNKIKMLVGFLSSSYCFLVIVVVFFSSCFCRVSSGN